MSLTQNIFERTVLNNESESSCILTRHRNGPLHIHLLSFSDHKPVDKTVILTRPVHPNNKYIKEER